MKYCLISLLSLITTFGLGQTRIKILTYNIYHGELAYEKGKPNLDSVAFLVNKLQPDFVAFQEVDSSTGRITGIYGKKINYIEKLAAYTGMYGYFGKAMDYDGGGYGEGLLSKMPLKVKVVTLPSPAGGEPRAFIYGETNLQDGQKLMLGGTHLCHQFEQNRLEQVKLIDSLAGNLSFPSIICGDFNFESTEAPYTFLMKRWKDAATENNSVANTYSFKNPDIRIDYAFFTHPGKLKILKTELFPVSYSDHLPVLFTFEFTSTE